jgi:Leishmanolysin
MSKTTSYIASSKLAPGAASDSVTAPYKIEVRFLGGLSAAQMAAFKAAADRWARVIVGDLPSVRVDGEVIDDVLILAQGGSIDGPGRVLGQAGPTALRPASAGRNAFLPAKGVMLFDSADLDEMEANGTLNDVIAHEMGHVLGIGTIWDHKRLLKRAGTSNPVFVGVHAKEEYGKLKGRPPTAVPVENRGGDGTRDSHWRDTVFGQELMTGFVGDAGNPLSRLTVASLRDLGYVVDLETAEPYSLPTPSVLAEAGVLAGDQTSAGHVLPVVPILLPEESLDVP